MKDAKPSWSYGQWARLLRLKSTSSLTKVVQGDRTPGADMVDRLVKYFQFDESAEEYFRDLIRYDKAKDDPGLRRIIAERIKRRHPDSPIQVLEADFHSIVANWYVFPIREMVKMKDFIEDSAGIAKRFLFKVTPEQVSAAIGELLRASLLGRDAKGRLVFRRGRVITREDVPSEAVRSYHEQSLGNAKKSLREVDVESREFFGTTLVIRASDLAEAKKAIREFRSVFEQKFETDEGDSLYQLQLQLFPLLRRQTEENES